MRPRGIPPGRSFPRASLWLVSSAMPARVPSQETASPAASASPDPRVETHRPCRDHQDVGAGVGLLGLADQGCAHPSPLVNQPDQSLRVVESRLVVHGHEPVNQVEAQAPPQASLQGRREAPQPRWGSQVLARSACTAIGPSLDLVRAWFVVDLAVGPEACLRSWTPGQGTLRATSVAPRIIRTTGCRVNRKALIRLDAWGSAGLR